MACNCNEGNVYHLNLGCVHPALANPNAYYTKSEIDEKLEDIIESGCCISPEEVDEKIESAITSLDLSDYAKKEDIPSLSGYATEQWVLDKHYITGVDLSDYVTNEGLSSYTYDKETIDEKISSGGTFDPTQYYSTANTYNKTEINNLINSAKTEVEGEIPSLSGYATEQWVTNQGYLTEHQHLKTINNESLVGDGNIVISGGTSITIDPSLDSGSTNAVANSAITIAINAKADKSEIPTSNSALTNDAGYITYLDIIGYINSLQSQINALNIALNECCGGSGDTGDTSDGKLFVRYQNNTTKTLECGIENNVSFEDYKPYYNLVEENVIEQGDIATITYAKVGDCVTVIRNSAFSGCTSLSKIDLPFDSLNNNTQYSASSIDDAAFANTAIQSVGLQGDSTTSVQLPSAYTQVAMELFSGCTALTTVELGANVEKIQMHSFKGCTNLQSITLHRTSDVTIIYDRHLGTDSLSDVGNNTFVVYVPSELVNTYKAADGWSNYADRIQAIQ